jgi:hypothetical protein
VLISVEYSIRIKIPFWLDYFLALPVLLYRRLRHGCFFRRIPLTKDKFAIVDPDDYYWLKKFKWFASKNGATYYAKRNVYSWANSRRCSVAMHRLIIKAPDYLVVDHINYNGLDNREANLRLATHKQNTRHVIRTMNPGSSKYKGVSWYTREKVWAVKIMADGKTIRIGYFKDEVEAAKAYDTAAKKYHGEFAALNFPCPRK